MKKRTEFFGQDPADVPAVSAGLLASAEAQPDLHWAALIDAAFDYPNADGSPYWDRGINCYESQAYAGLEKAAPILVPIDPVNDQAFLTRLLRHCYDRPMVSFLATRVDLKKLCALWQPLHWITAIDHQRMLLRLADTRILSALPQILELQQWAAFAGPVVQWVLVNRSGGLASLNLPSPDAATVPTIHLEQNQLAALLSHAEPDNILSLISDSMSDILPQLPNSKCFAMVSASCELARKHEVNDWTDVVSLAVAGFLTGGKTTEDESVAAYLSTKRWTPGELGTTLVSENFL